MPRKRRYYNPWGQGGYEFDKWLYNLAPAEGQNAYQAQEAYNAYARSEAGMQGGAQNYGEAGLQNAFQNMLSPAWEAERDNAQAAIEQGWQQQSQGLNGPRGRPIPEYSFEISQNGFYDNWRVPTKTSSVDPFYWKKGVVYGGKSKFAKEVVESLNYLLGIKHLGRINVVVNGKNLNGNVITDFLEGGKYQTKKIKIVDPIPILNAPSNKEYLTSYLRDNQLYDNNIWATGGVDESNQNKSVDSEFFTIYYNPFIGIKSFWGDKLDDEKNYATPPIMMLLHELAHAWLYCEGISHSLEKHENVIIKYIEIPAIQLINAQKNTNYVNREGYYPEYDLFFLANELFDYTAYGNPTGYLGFFNSKKQNGFSRLYMTDSSITTLEVFPQDFKYLKTKVGPYEYPCPIDNKTYKLKLYSQITQIDGKF